MAEDENGAPAPARRLIVDFDASGAWRLHIDPPPTGLADFEIAMYCVAALRRVVEQLEAPPIPVVASQGLEEGVADVCED